MNYSKIKVQKNISRPDIVFDLVAIPGTSRVLLASSDFNIHDLDISQQKSESKTLSGHASYVTTLALGKDVLASGSYDGKIIFWNISKNEKIKSLDAHQKWIRKITLSPDGKLLASVADDMVLRLWSFSEGKLIREMKGEHTPLTPHHFQSMLYACTFNSDGSLVASADKTGHVVVWETKSGKKVASVEAPIMYTWDPSARRHSIGGPRSLAFSPDSKYLAVGGTGKIGNIDHLEANARIEVFEWQKQEKSKEFIIDKHKGLVEFLEFHPDGNILLGAGGAGEGFICFVDLKENKVAHQEKAQMNVHGVFTQNKMTSILAGGHHRVMEFQFEV